MPEIEIGDQNLGTTTESGCDVRASPLGGDRGGDITLLPLAGAAMACCGGCGGARAMSGVAAAPVPAPSSLAGGRITA